MLGMRNVEKVVIKNLNKPDKEKLEDLFQWFCQVFDLSGKDNETEPGLFKEIIEGSVTGKGVTSKVLNKKLSLPRSTVIYHLNRFIGSGLVIRQGTKYYLRSDDMASTIEELQADLSREFGRMIEIAERMDKMLESDIYGRRKGRRK